MSQPVHLGFKFVCETYQDCEPLEIDARTERTAIMHARDAGWFIGRVRITAGGTGGVKRRCLCPCHCYLVGAE